MTLATLRVRDLATIADVTLELGAGLNVLTGETGAGKSMLVDALALLLGDRADRAAIRPGATKAVIDGVFEGLPASVRRQLDEGGFGVEDTLVLRREVTAEGRSRAWINDSPATIRGLASIGEVLVDLHGQHQTVQLLEPAMQRRLLDAYGDAEGALRAVQIAHAELGALKEEQAGLVARRTDAERRADWLRHVVTEIDAAKPKPGEEEALDREAMRLSQAGTLGEHAERINEALDGDEGSARSALAAAERALNAIERLDPETAVWRELLDNAYAQLDEVARRAREYAHGIADDPARLVEVERRRDILHALRRKHGPTLEDVLRTREASRAELDLLDTAEIDLRAIASRIASAEKGLGELAAALSARRTRGAAGLSREVTRVLVPLGLGGGEFSVSLELLAHPGPDGAESVTFVVRLNRGMEPRPLAKVASGGELSRLMLALKVVLARQDAVPTLVFDEVDQGIGGEVGNRVADALGTVAQRHQVLVITHLPQIAAHADRHLRIAKANRGGVATSDVAVLHGEDRVIEVARMLGSADDVAARKLAASMLDAGVSA